MDEVHDPHTCTTITVIGYPLCQDWNQGGFTSIDVTDDTDFDKLLGPSLFVSFHSKIKIKYKRIA
jgi:hypothetical protein